MVTTGAGDHVAADAAHRAGVTVEHPRSVSQLHAMAELFAAVWGTAADSTPVPADVLRALVHVEAYVATASRNGELVARSAGFFTSPQQAGLHSHILGVRPGVQSTGVGLALKLDQREWAFRHGLRTITWTFDPLLRRNAYLNLARLGARATRYLPDFYGDMTDELNAGQGSDRLLVEWAVQQPLPERPASDPASGPAPDSAPGREPDPRVPAIVEEGSRGEPLVAPVPPALPRAVVARIPEDIVRLRSEDAVLAGAWRLAIRQAFTEAFAQGYVVTGMTRSGWYRLERPDPAS